MLMYMCVSVCVCMCVSVCVCVGTYINIIHMSCVRAYSSVCVCMFVCTHMCGFGSMETCTIHNGSIRISR